MTFLEGFLDVTASCNANILCNGVNLFLPQIYGAHLCFISGAEPFMTTMILEHRHWKPMLSVC